jgi:hypothetical protein
MMVNSSSQWGQFNQRRKVIEWLLCVLEVQMEPGVEKWCQMSTAVPCTFLPSLTAGCRPPFQMPGLCQISAFWFTCYPVPPQLPPQTLFFSGMALDWTAYLRSVNFCVAWESAGWNLHQQPWQTGYLGTVPTPSLWSSGTPAWISVVWIRCPASSNRGFSSVWSTWDSGSTGVSELELFWCPDFLTCYLLNLLKCVLNSAQHKCSFLDKMWQILHEH